MKKKQPDPTAARYVSDLSSEDQTAVLGGKGFGPARKIPKASPAAKGQGSGSAKKRSPRAS